MGFPSESADKESACSAGDLESNPEFGGSRGEGHNYPFHGLRNLVGCNPWGHKESDTTA